MLCKQEDNAFLTPCLSPKPTFYEFPVLCNIGTGEKLNQIQGFHRENNAKHE